MRTFKTSLFVLAMAAPSAALAQEAASPPPVQLAEEPAAEAPAPAAEAPAAEAPAAEAAPAASASASVSTTTASTTADAAAAKPAASLARPNSARSRGGPEGSATWEFGYHGYFRAPMRVGVGTRSNRICSPGTENANNAGEIQYDVDSCSAAGAESAQDGQSSTTYHAPIVPDDQYLSWQSTSHNKRDWAEMFFSVGNGTVSGNLAVQGFQFTDSSWAQPENQFGIGQGWVEINSDLGYENIKFNAKVGSFWRRYGMAGRYDAGEYDTYLFGRTHAMGASARTDFDLGGKSVGFEVGLGAHRPDPDMYNRTRFTMLADGHLFYNLEDMEFSAHLMHAWASSETPLNQQTGPLTGNTLIGPNATASNGQLDILPDGKQTVMGVDGRFDLGVAGYLYAGWAMMKLSNAITVAPAIESIHSFGGGEFNLGATDNYLETAYCQKQYPVQTGSCSGGNGSINTIMAQYELGLANFDVFEGNQDLRFKLYGMMNFVSSDDKDFLETDSNYAPLVAAAGIDQISQDGVRKSKFGIDADFLATSWLSAGLRYDTLSPNSKIPEQNFSVISPRLTFHTDFVTREQISIQYSRYMYAQRECEVGNPAGNPFDASHGYAALNGDRLPGRVYCVQPPPSAVTPDGFGAHAANQDSGTRGAPTFRPDVNVFKIEASMWW